jgi:3-phenylpropionate/trans-cinnamate dioxygenase ferredoxin subunit
MAEFTRVAAVGDIPPGETRGFTVGHERIMIANLDGTFYALTDECSHDSAPVSGGKLQGHEIVCPRHGAKFDVRSGAVTGPPAVVGIDNYEVRVEGEDILVKLG